MQLVATNHQGQEQDGEDEDGVRNPDLNGVQKIEDHLKDVRKLIEQRQMSDELKMQVEVWLH